MLPRQGSLSCRWTWWGCLKLNIDLMRGSHSVVCACRDVGCSGAMQQTEHNDGTHAVRHDIPHLPSGHPTHATFRRSTESHLSPTFRFLLQVLPDLHII